MAGNAFEFDMGFNFSEAINNVKNFAKQAENSLEKLLNPKMNLDSSAAKKALDDLTKDLKTTQQIINGINVPTNEIKKMADEFNKVQKSASQSINEQKQALAQMVIAGQKGTKEFADLEKQLKDNVKASNVFKDSLNQIEKELDQLDGKNVEVDFDKDGKGTSNFKSRITDMGKMAGVAALAGGAALAVVGIKKAIDAGVEFQKTLADFSAITGVQGKALDNFGESAKKMSLQFGGSATDQVNTFKGILSRLGPDIAKSPEALERMSVAVNTLSLASGMDATQSMDAMTTAALQFGVDLSSPIKASKEMTDMINVMAAGAKEGAAEIPQISEALAVSGAVARASGVSFLELNAGIQVMAQGGKYGAEAGTALRNVMVGMQEVSKEGSASLSKLGIDSKDLAVALQTGGLGGALKVINDKFGESSDQIAKNQVLIDLFGKENIAAGATLVAGANDLETYKKKLEGTNVAFEQAKTNSQTFSHQISLMKANLEDVGLKLFDSLKPALDSVFKLFQDPKLMQGISAIVSNVAKGIAPIIEILGTTLAPLLITVGELIGEVFSTLVPPIVALIKPIMELANVLLDALMPVFKSMLPVLGQLVQSLAELLASLMPLIKMVLPLLISSLNVVALAGEGVTYAVIGITKGLTWLIAKITDSIKWIGDLFNSLGKLLGLKPEEKHKKHTDAVKENNKEVEKLSSTMKSTATNATALSIETDKNSKSLNMNTGAIKANVEAKKTLLEQLTELTNKSGASTAISSKVFADYVIELTLSEKQKAENDKVKVEATRIAEIMNRDVQPIIDNYMNKEPLVIPLEHLELTATGVEYKPLIDNIKDTLEISFAEMANELANTMQPIPFQVVDTKQIDEDIAELKDSYNKGETDYEIYIKKLKDLEKQKADAVIDANDMISNSLQTVGLAMEDMALKSFENFQKTGEGLNDFLAQSGIALGSMLGAALTSSGDQQKQILIQALSFVEKLVALYAVDIVALFTGIFPPPFGIISGLAAVAGIYTMLEVAKAKVGADQGVIDIDSNYKKPATSRDVIPIWVRKGESILTPEETKAYIDWKNNFSKINTVNNNGDYNDFAKIDYNVEKDYATLNELSQLRREVANLRNALSNQRTEVYDKRELIIKDNRKIEVKQLPIYG